MTFLARREIFPATSRARVGLLVVDRHAVDLFGQPVAHDALHQIRLLIDAGRRAHVLDVALQDIPRLPEVAQIPDEGPLAGARAHRAHDQPRVVRQRQTVQDLLQALALLRVADLTRDAAQARARHHHEVASRQTQIGRDARALVLIGPFVTWTTISDPAGNRLAISSFETRRRRAGRALSSSSSSRLSSSGSMSQ
jgi:hypothetical protein